MSKTMKLLIFGLVTALTTTVVFFIGIQFGNHQVAYQIDNGLAFTCTGKNQVMYVQPELARDMNDGDGDRVYVPWEPVELLDRSEIPDSVSMVRYCSDGYQEFLNIDWLSPDRPGQ